MSGSCARQSRGGAAAPLDRAEFADLMASLGPFEPRPGLAVAVSGGADSLALTCLLNAWTRSCGGRLLALTVDHGLRRGSAAEARFVADMLASLGIEHWVLRWRGPKPQSNVQAAARRARYDLLLAACARQGVLHLALAHHLDDQAETLLLRLARGSGLDGLAAMAPVSELAALRLLRPLLGVSKARLVATLQTRGLEWIEDPTNEDPGHARTRLRQLLPDLAPEGLTPERLAATAGHLGRARAALDLAVARVLAATVRLDPRGHGELNPEPLLAAPEETSLRALARVLTTLGGTAYPPRLERLCRLRERLIEGLPRGATLGGCRLLRHRDRILVVREARALPKVPVRPGERLRWDGRFDLVVHSRARSRGGRLMIGPLGARGWAEVRAAVPELAKTRVPAPARVVLPALFDRKGVLAVPGLGYQNRGPSVKTCRFRPQNLLSQSVFTVV